MRKGCLSVMRMVGLIAFAVFIVVVVAILLTLPPQPKTPKTPTPTAISPSLGEKIAAIIGVAAVVAVLFFYAVVGDNQELAWKGGWFLFFVIIAVGLAVITDFFGLPK